MQQFKALYFKEFREHRTSLACILGMPVVWLFWTRPDWFFGGYLGIYMTYVTSMAAVSYAKEEESDSARFLRMLPIRSGTILLAKLAWLLSVMLLLLIFPVLVAVSALFWYHDSITISTLSDSLHKLLPLAGECAAFLFCLISWGYFWTTRCPSKMYAILASFSSFMIVFLIVGLGALKHSIANNGGVLSPPNMILMLLVATSPITILALWRMAGYFRHAEPVHTERRPFLNAPRQESDWKIRLINRFFPAEHRTPFQALLWQTICQSRDVLFLGAIVFLLLGLWQIVPAPSAYRILGDVQFDSGIGDGNWAWFVKFFVLTIYGFGMVIALGIASTIFAQDKDRDQYRALVYRGVPAGVVWWSRILPFLAVYSLAVPIIILMCFQIVPEASPFGMIAIVLLALLTYFTVFCFGSFYSLLCQNVLTAKILNIGTCWMMMVLMSATVKAGCEVWSFFWVPVPMMLSFLIASRLTAGTWFRNDAPMGRYAIPLCVIACGTLLASLPLLFSVLFFLVCQITCVQF